MVDAAAYEAQRRRQIEENKRRIEELGLRQLAAAAMPPQAKRPKPKAPGAAAASSMAAMPRRSGRVANLSEQPDYCEKTRKKIVMGTPAEERSYAIAKAKAKELECELGADYPTFVRTMTQYTASGFALSIPLQFCREHLPEHSKVITLVDEEDDEYEVQYYKGPSGNDYRISSNWKWFADNHELDNGDCLVFQLIQQTKFKVYIMRARSYLEKDDHQN